MASTVPKSLHDVSKFMLLAQNFASRDPVIYYWTCFHVVNEGMKIDKSSPEAMTFLTNLLTELENLKKANTDAEAFRNEIVAQAHLENVALKIFRYADENERQGNFEPKIRNAFYQASLLMDVLAGFKELDESLANVRKYAKWKAAYLLNCEKNKETPVSGGYNPEKPDEFPSQPGMPPQAPHSGPSYPQPGHQRSGPTPLDPPPPAPTVADLGFGSNGNPNQQMPSSYSSDPSLYQTQQNQFHGYPPQNNMGYPQQPQMPQQYNPAPPPRPSVQPKAFSHPPPVGNVTAAPGLKLEDYIEARKFCKYALSALDYEDAPAAVDNMLKSLRVLQGQAP
uniref:Vacuolar protein sorting-associated protein VTA1 n=1 Tax=Panagrolaimus sp. JU765 TaxID=591449 RepID=A0AC34QP69_9BILA